MKRKGIISIVLLIFSIGLIIIYYTYSINENELKIEKVNKYKDKIIQNNKESIINKEEYQGLLEITKINLLLGFYNNDSSENNVNKNIQKIGNDTPDMKNATIILAAHSGNSYLGYFKNLDKLNINDFINIYYNNKKYLYIINNIYEEDKNGKISINKNMSDNILILTTCSKNKNKQLIIESKIYNII